MMVDKRIRELEKQNGQLLMKNIILANDLMESKLRNRRLLDKVGYLIFRLELRRKELER